VWSGNGGSKRMEPRVHRYIRIWWQIAVMSVATQMANPFSSFGYLLGKLFRLGFFIIFLMAIFRHTDALAGYTLAQTALFFLTFNMVDILAQLFFRGIYGIRSIVRDGDFDYFLIQPTPLLWRVCFSTVDFLDVLTIVPVAGATFYTLTQIPGATEPIALGLYALLVANGLLIAFAMHVMVAALAVWTQEMDNTIWIYRDLMTLGRFPSEIYASPMQFLMIFVIPIAVMVSFPAKAAIGLLDIRWVGVAALMAAVSVVSSVLFWRFACRRYTSVSS